MASRREYGHIQPLHRRRSVDRAPTYSPDAMGAFDMNIVEDGLDFDRSFRRHEELKDRSLRVRVPRDRTFRISRGRF